MVASADAFAPPLGTQARRDWDFEKMIAEKLGGGSPGGGVPILMGSSTEEEEEPEE